MRVSTLRVLGALVLAFTLAGAAPAAELTLSGRVVDENGGPLADARVELRPVLDLHTESLRLLEGKGRAKPVARGRSDRQGRFELTAPEIGLWQVTVTAEGRVPMSKSFRPLLRAEALPDVRLLSAVATTVTITDGDSPVAGALVDARIREFAPWRQAWRAGHWGPGRRWGLTGDDGRVTLPLARQEQPEIGATRAGFGAGTAAATGAAVRVSLAPSQQRALKVVEADGKPAAGVLFLDSWRPLGITDQDGSIQLPAVYLERQPTRLIVSTSGGYQAMLTEIAADQTVLELLPPYEVSGRVADRATGRPIAGALVWRARGPAAAIRTDAQGRFHALTAETSTQLGFAAEGYRPQRQKVETGSGIASDLAVALESATMLTGRVITEDHLPVVDARVKVRPVGTRQRSWNRRGAADTVITSTDGSFRLGGLSAGELHDILVYQLGYAPAAATATAPAVGDQAPEVEIILRPGANVFGYVVDTDNQAIAGARVRLNHQPAEGEARLEIAEGENLSAPETMTDDTGRFMVHGLPAGEHAAEIRHRGHASRNLPGIRLEAAAPDLDLGTITLATAAAIEVKVVDPEGEPIAGVNVRLTARNALGARWSASQARNADLKTDTEGIIRHDDFEVGQRVDLWLNHPSYAERKVQGVEAPTPETLEIVLLPGATLSGVVVGEDGRSLPRVVVRAGTEVTTKTHSGSSTGTFYRWHETDAEGRFELLGITPGDVRLSARLEGYALEVLPLRLAEGERRDDLRIELYHGASISGRVVDAAGQPVIGCEVSLTHRAGAYENRGTGTNTDGEGRFRMTGRPLGLVEVSARHREHGATSTDVELRPGENSVELRLAPNRLISGRVIDASGQPLPGANISLTWHSNSSTSTSYSEDVKADGSFFFVPENPGSYELSAEHEGLVRTALPLTVGEESISGLELVLRPGAAISGTVLGISPEERGRVTIWTHSSSGQGRVHNRVVDAHGNYRISGLEPGTWRLQALLPGSGRKAEATVEVLTGESEVVRDLQLDGGDLKLIGVVIAGGRPAAGVNVSTGGDSGSHSWVTASHDGRFHLEGLKPGTYELRITGDFGTHTETVELWSDRDLTVSLELRRVAGRVTSSDGAPLAGVALTLLDDDAGPNRSSSVNQVSDANGAFEFPQVRAARYRLLAPLEGFITATAIVDVQDTDVLGLEIILDRGAPLVLEVRTASGKPTGPIQVAALDAGGRPMAFAESEPGPDGRFEVTAIPPGTWQLTIVAAETVPARLNVEVPGGPYAVVLEPSTQLRVSVPALVDSNVPATLTLLDAAGRPVTPSQFGMPMETWMIHRGEIILPF